MRTLRLLVPFVLLASPLAAQREAPRLEIGADFSYWQLDGGGSDAGETSRPAGTVRAAIVIPSRLPATLGFSGSFAPEDGIQPGLLAFSSEFAQRLSPAQAGRVNVFLAAGAGILRLKSEEQERIIDECQLRQECIYEGPSHRGDWSMMATVTVGADVGIARRVLAQPTLAFVTPFGQGSASGEGTMVRLGIGLAVRP
jgi:hypothetical protein